MKFSLAIFSPPTPGIQAELAFEFAQILLAQNHSIYRLFFFSDGVFNCITHPSNTGSLPERWSRLILDHKLDAVTCVSSAEKRGIAIAPTVDVEREAGRLKPLLPGFQISGLAQLIDASLQSDRLVTFGG